MQYKYVQSGATNYRYGFNGKENDNDVKGDGNSLDFGARIYDPRLGRFLSVDPLGYNYPWQSSYAYAGNNPIKFIDLDGEGPGEPIDATLEFRLRFKLRAISFVDVLKRSNNFSLRALENWGWKPFPTQQQENKVKGLAGESTVVSDLRTIPLFTHEKQGRKSSWAPYLAPATLNKTDINFSGDGDADRTVDILYRVQAGTSFSDFSRFGITMPFVNSNGGVVNNNKGETYSERTTNFVIEVKTGTSTANFSKGFFQALRQTLKPKR